MSDERHRRLVEIFNRVRELPPEERQNALEELGKEDRDLSHRVEALLKRDLEGTEFLERPALGSEIRGALPEIAASLEEAPTRTSPGELAPGMPSFIAGYRLLGVLGEGAMGTVFLAEQRKPGRRVALKLVRAGWAGEKLLQRFEHEAEVLGRLQHPGIAQIFEAGTFEWRGSSLPYFVMEYVEGEDLKRYAEKRSLGTRARLELLSKVCEAIHHAHQKGVVHRDLKPDNILVTASGQPKILDFGVARVTDSDLQITTVATDVGQLIGTLFYMSPEQASGSSGDLDTRSDVYALGVIGFELLTGQLPYDLREKPITDAVGIIQNEEPSRLGSLERRLRGDVETIISKALEKDKERRYQSAAELAADIWRYLRDEPIVARPPSTVYQLRKFARRNRGLVAGVAGLLVVSLLAALISSTLYVRAERDREKAEWQAYLANLAAAESAVRDRRFGNVRERLSQVPEHLRGWEWNALWNRADPSTRTFEGHRFHIWMVAPSPEGRRVYSCAGDATVRVLDLETGEAEVLRDHEDRVFSVAASPDGSRFASGSADRTIRLRDSQTLETIAVLEGHGDGIHALGFSPDGKWLASGASNGTLKLWDARSGKLIRDLAGHPEWIWFLAFSPSDELLATTSKDDTIRLWDPRTGEVVDTLAGHEDDVHAVAFSPGGRWLASASLDRTVRLWDLETGVCAHVLRGHEKWVGSVAFSPDGEILLSASLDRTVRAWKVTTAELLGKVTGHTECVRSVAFLPDGSFVTGSWDDTVKLWQPDSIWKAAARQPRAGVTAFAFSPQGDLIAVGDDEGNVVLEELRTREVRARFPLASTRIARLAFSSDGNELAAEYSMTSGSEELDWDSRVANIDTQVSVLDVASGETLHEEVGRLPRFLPDGRRFATTTYPSIRLYDRRWERALSVEEPGNCEGLYSLALSPDGRTLASSCVGDNYARLRDAVTGEILAELECDDGMVTSVAFSADGQLLATTSGSDSRVRVWDVTGHRLVDSVFADQARAAVFSPAAPRLVSGGEGVLKVWALDPLEELVSINFGEERIEKIAFSPDGELLAVLTKRGLTFWDGGDPGE